jgi:phosphoribosylamine--glycine ligase
VVTTELHQIIVDTIVRPTIAGMAKDGCPYSGILYVGLMIKDGKPRVVEYNARFGDPEAQPLLMRMKSDIVPILAACARGELGDQNIEWFDKAAVCVVMASGGYPAEYVKGLPISGLEDAATMEDVMVFHAGTGLEQGQIVNRGGRVLGVTGLGSTVAQAISNAYQAVEKIHWDNVHYRRDIGARALQHAASAGEKK